MLEEAIKLAGGFDIPDLFSSLRFVGYLTGTIPAMIKLRDKIGKILESIVDDHKIKRSEVFSSTAGNDKAKDEEDFVDVLLNLQESNKLEFNSQSIRSKMLLWYVNPTINYECSWII